MANIEIVTLETAREIEPVAGQSAQVRSRAYFDGAANPLHLRLHQLGAHAELSVADLPSDALVYVWKGAVLVEGVRLDERSSMIVERDACARIAAAAEGAAVLVFSLPRQAAGNGVEPRLHLLPKDRVPSNWDLSGMGTAGGALHADASRREAPLWLHENDFYVAGFQVAVHSHSEDEIIFVRAGELRLGDRRYGPGAALAIAANARYGFHVGPEGLSFVNFRGGPPTYTAHDGGSMDEAEFWRAETGRPAYLELPCG